MKTKLKSIVSVVLTLMMVVSMVTIAFPTINAATIDEPADVAATVDDASAVAATTYYLWYNNSGNNNPPYTSSITMTAEGSNYVATFDVKASTNFGFLINTNASSCKYNCVWTSAPTVNKSSDFQSWTGGKYGWYDTQNYAFVEGCATFSGTMKVTYNPSNKQVTLIKDEESGGGGGGNTDLDPNNTIIFVDKNTYDSLYVWDASEHTPNGEWGNCSITSCDIIKIDGTDYYIVIIANEDFGSNTTFNMLGLKNGNKVTQNDITDLKVGGSYILKRDTTYSEYSIDASTVTPTFVDGKTEDFKNVKPGKTLTLDVTATLIGVANASQYLTYSTVITSGNGGTLTDDDSSDPKFSSSTLTTYTLKTTVTNTENGKTATRTTTVKVTNDIPDDEYKVAIISNGSVTSTIDMEESPEGSGIYLSTKKITLSSTVFTIQRTIAGGSPEYANSGSGDYWLKPALSGRLVQGWDGNTNQNFSGHDFNYTTMNVKYDSINDIVSLVETSVIYLTKGTNGGTANYCNSYYATGSIISSATTPTAYSSYAKKYTVTEDGLVEVSVTISSTYSGNYYIPAFVVNGISYTATSRGNGRYTANIPVEADAEAYEIIPIYYSKACQRKGEYIKFYVNTNDLLGKYYWDNIISCYSYYYKNGKNKNEGVGEADGTYPGQPMLYDNEVGMYYALLPKVMNDCEITGITINNYYYNQPLHQYLSVQTNNIQSYDFNDMKYLEDQGNDIIRFDVMPRKASYTNISWIDGNYSFNPSTFASDGHNAFDDFTDINGNLVDIYGEKVDASADVGLYIISTGKAEQTEVGQWATTWYVYDATSKTRITKGFPSDFIPRVNDSDNTTAYKALFSGTTKTYAGKKVMISYENYQNLDNADRYDGRWYYANSALSTVDVDVKYQLSNDNGDTWTSPAEDSSIAYVDVDGAINTSATVKIGTTVAVVAKAPTGYIFDSFWTVDKNGKFISKLNSGNSISPELSFDMHYVARFVKAAANTLTISHSKLTGVDAAGNVAKGGSGFYQVEAQILDKNNKAVGSVIKQAGNGSTGQQISVPLSNANVSDGYQLQIRLITTTSGLNEFRHFYEDTEYGVQIIGSPDNGTMTWTDSSGKVEQIANPFGKNGTITYTFKTTYANLFDGYELKTSELLFYSDITPITASYSITYNYKDRFGVDKSYIYKGEHDDSYYELHGSWTPDTDLIKAHAPYIDDLYKDCTWNIDSVSADGTSVVVSAVQNDKTYKVTIYYEAAGKEGLSEEYTLKLNDYVYKDHNVPEDERNIYIPERELYIADPSRVDVVDGENVTKYFKYWQVVEVDPSTASVVANTDSDSDHIVAKCYSAEFNLRVSCNCEIIPVYAPKKSGDDDDKDKEEEIAFISDAQYTREQYTQNGQNYDYLYADFIVAYMEKNGVLLRETGTSYKTGIIVEYDTQYKLKENVAGATLADKDKLTYEDEGLTEAQVNACAKGQSVSELPSSSRKLVNFNISSSSYNDQNRLDYYLKFKNTDNFKRYVYRAYYYVIYTNDKGEEVTVVSKPVYFYLYDIGNSLDPNNNTATIG
ncbi:MAG: hypothetical protein J1E85_06085 [Ruminococcus sp.]|nr:hypothetical protein [Ruminococcus sp.]